MSSRVGLTNQLIIETAANIADTEGLDSVTLTAVAQRLGVQKPSLYNHIKGLTDLRRGLTLFGTNQLRIRIMEAAMGQARADAILAISAAYRTFAHERPGLYQATLLSWDHQDNPQVQAAIKELMEVLKKVLGAYRLQNNDLVHAQRGLRSLMHGFVTLEASGWFTQPVARDESYLQLVNIFIRGIEVRAVQTGNRE